MTWWIWIVIGLALLIAEVAVPGGIILVFFGAAALILGVLVALHVVGPLWLQLLIFSALSVVMLMTLRGPMLKRLKAGPQQAEPDQIDNPVGETVLLLGDLPPQAEGHAEFRGTSWRVRNVGGEALSRGQRRVVKEVRGLTLLVQ